MSSDKSFVDTVVDTVAEAWRQLGNDSEQEGVSDMIVGNAAIDLSNVKEFRIHIGSD